MSIVELRKEPAWRCRQLMTKPVDLSDSKMFKVVKRHHYLAPVMMCITWPVSRRTGRFPRLDPWKHIEDEKPRRSEQGALILTSQLQFDAAP